MGRLLDRLRRGTAACVVKDNTDGFTLVAKPGRIDEFSELVREASENAGEEFVVFATSEGHHRYSQMYVLPIQGASSH